MNQAPADMYYSQPHMSAGPAPPTQTVTSYNPQPPILQPGPAQYPAPPQQYSQYYPNGMTSPPGPPGVPGQMGASGGVLPLPGSHGATSGPGSMQNQYQGFDTTGQVAPPGMKPRVTATLWEDEGSLCFQVEARGICVARREDNHMINGTKLLNVAGMTRGRRDGILKSEKVRHVVKIGPMHLKGVWIPFERALDFANKEKITELLYPLFVHNISALLYHPTNQNRTNQVMAAAERRKAEQSQLRNGPGPAPPGLPSLHHHSMSSHPAPQQGINGQQQNPMSIDTNLSNSRSMPHTPATTPPSATLQSMQAYPPSSQPYDSSRQMYSAPPSQQSPYPPSNSSPQDRSIYGPPGYVKSEMGPPSNRPAGAQATTEHPQEQQKPVNGLMHPSQSGEPVPHSAAEEEADHEHDAEYTHDSGAYDTSRGQSYNYSAPPVSSLPNEHSHLSPELSGPGGAHHATSGRSTPRSAAAPPPYYGAQGYTTPPRTQTQSSSNVYNVMSNDRSATSSTAPAGDVYAPPSDMQNGYSAPVVNGGSGGMKRGRDDDDERPTSGGGGGVGGMELKRRKTLVDGSMPSPVYETMNRPATAVAAPQRRR
ncbi:cell pattern formation-associated protein stuA [Magnaporthiopsis poae ATCC 64411]|uniref:Cell pattern formation-associated protein stuA n=1 Tax=Magnaporthiopsis poae (strain ATCC 64411 / 73-15) TaxID=644358 RepID=A0A0C4E4Z9_MAGP6|nr:cell pattern formation-associated protein stuA [Magnaporthiopsis poae ATCC 64411]